VSAPAVHHNRVLATRDFSGPDLAPYFADIFPHERTRFGDGWPAGHPYRKYWEVAMAARALDRHGVLHREAEVIGIGAGNEPTLFWLTRHVRRVFATDLYLTPGVWGDFANPAMLGAPGEQWPGAWDRRRLVPQHMDALDLAHQDDSFDAVFSSSSIEHFGDLAAVRTAMGEAFRVLRPGGVLSLSTEFRLAGRHRACPAASCSTPTTCAHTWWVTATGRWSTTCSSPTMTRSSPARSPPPTRCATSTRTPSGTACICCTTFGSAATRSSPSPPASMCGPVCISCCANPSVRPDDLPARIPT